MGIVEQGKMVTAILQDKPDYVAYQEGMQCSEENAKKHASQYMQEHPEVKEKCIAILERREGLTRNKALDAVERCLNATNQGKYGTVTEYASQLESAKLLLRLYGELTDRPQTDIHIDQHSINICLTPDYIDRLNKTLDRFDRMMSKPDIIDGEIVRSKVVNE